MSISSDFTTSIVIDWLICDKYKYTRINSDSNLKIEINNKIYIYNIFLDEIKSYWYRKGLLINSENELNLNELLSSHIPENDIKLFQ